MILAATVYTPSPLKVRDIHWLAGLYEGEGSFTIHTQTRYGRIERGATGEWTQKILTNTYPSIHLSMTDHDVVKHAAHLLRTTVLGPYTTNKGKNFKTPKAVYKPLYAANLHGKRAAGAMMMLFSLLGARRRAQIRKVLSECGYPVGAPQPAVDTQPDLSPVESSTPAPRRWPDKIETPPWYTYPNHPDNPPD